MKRRKFKIKKVRLIILFIIILCGYFILNFYNKLSPIDINTAKVEKIIDSEKLLASFKTNENYANSTFVEKVVIVEGLIKDITYVNDHYTIKLESQNDFSQIICGMSLSDNSDIKNLKVGQLINVKGICKGYLMDVIMLNCILVDK